MSESNQRWPLKSNLTTKQESWLLGMILLTAILLRVWNWNLIEIEHFDEAVYVSNIYFKALGGETYPAQEFYAPPLVPQVFETVMSIFGDSTTVIFSVNLVASLLTLVLLWWMGRSWFGPVCGLVAAAGFATSDVQIALSRSALTEPIFGFFFCLSLQLMYLTFRFTWNPQGETQELNPRYSVILGLLAGLACSCCWVTKYNGWLPCAIILTALFLNLLLTRQWFHVKQMIAPMLVMMLGCFVLRGLHVWKLVEDQLYQAVNLNHAGYFVGQEGWWGSLLEHRFQLGQTTGLITFLIQTILFALIIFPHYNLKHFSIRRILGFYLLLVNVSVLWFFVQEHALAVTLLQVLGISMAFRSIVNRPECFTWNQMLPLLMLLTWWGSLLLAIPLYSPYPRLIYPWLLSCWLGMGLTIALMQEARICLPNEQRLNYMPNWMLFTSIAVVCIGCLILNIDPAYRHSELVKRDWCDSWQVRTGLRDVSRETVELIQAQVVGDSNKVPVVYQLSEPAISFHVMRLGVTCLPVQNLSFIQNPELKQYQVYFIVGQRGRMSTDFNVSWEQSRSQFKLVKSFEYHPSAFVWRDERGDANRDKLPMETIELFEFIGTPRRAGGVNPL